jgi:hypothetical protein
MSKKYVPTFLRGGAEGVVNTSKPAVEAPKLAPATLASLTTAPGSNSVAKKSYGDKFAEQAKRAEDPNYVPPPKPLNLSSLDDFPSLGGPNKVVTNAVVAPGSTWGKPNAGGNTFADKAKSWAKEAEDAERKAKKRAEKEARRAAEKERLRGLIPVIRKPHRLGANDDSEEELEDRPYDDESIGDSDSYESPGEPPSDEDEEDEEQYNGEIGYDGRRKGDIY